MDGKRSGRHLVEPHESRKIRRKIHLIFYGNVIIMVIVGRIFMT